MKKYEKLLLMIAIGFVLVCFQHPLVYWYHHPELSELQLFLSKWPYYAGMLFATIYILSVYLRHDARR